EDEQGKKKKNKGIITFFEVGANKVSNPNGIFNDVGEVGYSKADGKWVPARRLEDDYNKSIKEKFKEQYGIPESREFSRHHLEDKVVVKEWGMIHLWKGSCVIIGAIFQHTLTVVPYPDTTPNMVVSTGAFIESSLKVDMTSEWKSKGVKGDDKNKSPKDKGGGSGYAVLIIQNTPYRLEEQICCLYCRDQYDVLSGKVDTSYPTGRYGVSVDLS
ncbi:hypothetical protein Tco_1141969, partial [Tanacetum coccineum]